MATKDWQSILTDTLIGLADIFGLGDEADQILRSLGPEMNKITGGHKDFTKNSSYNRLMQKIDEEVTKLRGTNSSKASRVNSLLNELTLIPTSQAFKGQINKIKRNLNDKLVNLDSIDKRITNYENVMRNTAEQLRDQRVVAEGRLTKPVTEEVNKTLDVLKKDIGRIENV